MSCEDDGGQAHGLDPDLVVDLADMGEGTSMMQAGSLDFYAWPSSSTGQDCANNGGGDDDVESMSILLHPQHQELYDLELQDPEDDGDSHRRRSSRVGVVAGEDRGRRFRHQPSHFSLAFELANALEEDDAPRANGRDAGDDDDIDGEDELDGSNVQGTLFDQLQDGDNFYHFETDGLASASEYGDASTSFRDRVHPDAQHIDDAYILEGHCLPSKVSANDIPSVFRSKSSGSPSTSSKTSRSSEPSGATVPKDGSPSRSVLGRSVDSRGTTATGNITKQNLVGVVPSTDPRRTRTRLADDNDDDEITHGDAQTAAMLQAQLATIQKDSAEIDVFIQMLCAPPSAAPPNSQTEAVVQPGTEAVTAANSVGQVKEDRQAAVERLADSYIRRLYQIAKVREEQARELQSIISNDLITADWQWQEDPIDFNVGAMVSRTTNDNDTTMSGEGSDHESSALSPLDATAQTRIINSKHEISFDEVRNATEILLGTFAALGESLHATRSVQSGVSRRIRAMQAGLHGFRSDLEGLEQSVAYIESWEAKRARESRSSSNSGSGGDPIVDATSAVVGGIRRSALPGLADSPLPRRRKASGVSARSRKSSGATDVTMTDLADHSLLEAGTLHHQHRKGLDSESSTRSLGSAKFSVRAKAEVMAAVSLLEDYHQQARRLLSADA